MPTTTGVQVSLSPFVKHKDPIDADLDPTDVENWPEDLVYEKTEYPEKDNGVGQQYNI